MENKMTPEEKKELDEIIAEFKKLKRDKKQKGVVIRENELIAYFKREFKGQTEFRVVVYEDGSGYAKKFQPQSRNTKQVKHESIQSRN